MIKIRHETTGDIAGIREVNTKAFGQSAEADLVDKLRRQCSDVLSIVAEENGTIIAHILFSPIYIEGSQNNNVGMALAPMAVLPERQNKGIGSLLIEHGLEILRNHGCPFVIVLGHIGYYPRFGFRPVSQFGISCQWPNVPDQAFMALELIDDALIGIIGVARYRSEFDEVI